MTAQQSVGVNQCKIANQAGSLGILILMEKRDFCMENCGELSKYIKDRSNVIWLCFCLQRSLFVEKN